MDCYHFLYKNETECDPPVYIEDVELEASDVCRPFWTQGTILQGESEISYVPGGQYITGTEDTRVNIWISLQMDDEWPW